MKNHIYPSQINHLVKLHKHDREQYLQVIIHNLQHNPDNYTKAVYLAVGLMLFPDQKPPAVPQPLIDLAKIFVARAKMQKHISGSTPKGMVTDYDVVPPSDQARKDTTVYRKEHGLVHLPPRTERIRPQVGVGSLGYADIWSL